MASQPRYTPERSRPRSRWFALGALLPAVVRRRLFEPAYYDLVREELVERKGERSGWAFGRRAGWLLVASFCLGVGLLLRDRERRRKLAVGLAWTAVVATLIMVVLLREWIGFIASNPAGTSVGR